ncbi:MAG: DUF3137 domain-containing protein [Gloeobacteraceae cyanobacterium ES-bin-316]|nr:DUF3137 domain-containing protein [Ferruginibacter sp.]
METVNDFESFYTQKIQPYIDELARSKSAAANWKVFTIFTAIGAIASFVLFHFKKFPGGGLTAAAMMAICVAGIYFSTKYADLYLDSFKEKIIRQILTYIYPGAVYKPMKFVSKREYKASGLFRRRFTHFDGDDYWECVYNGVSFHCSEVESSYNDATGSESIFKGLFVTVKLNAAFTGGTYVWAKDNIQLPAGKAQLNYRLFALPKVQKLALNHTLFNKAYSVYTSNAQEALVILNAAMLDDMLLIRDRLKRDIIFSFVAGNCYVAVPFKENLLEPSGSGLEDKEAIKNYFYTILLVFNIIKKLHLERLV